MTTSNNSFTIANNMISILWKLGVIDRETTINALYDLRDREINKVNDTVANQLIDFWGTNEK